MNTSSRLLACGACFALLAASGIARAQMAGMEGQSCNDIQMMRGTCGQDQGKKKTETTVQSTLYPNATRQEPKLSPMSDREHKALNEGLDAAGKGDADTAQKDLQPIAEGSDNAYAKALAQLGLGQLKGNTGDVKDAIALIQQALASNALPNDNYFQGLMTIAALYVNDEQYPQALQALDHYNRESGKQDAQAYGLQGMAYYRMQKYPEAVSAIQKAKSLTDKPQDNWDQILMASYYAMDKYDEAGKIAEQALARDPNNSALLMNVVQIYINAKQYDKALPLLERARANGQIKDETTWVNMAKLYYNIGLDGHDTTANANKAAQVLEDGMAKGIVQPSSANYKLLGDAYLEAGDTAKAYAAFDKGGVSHPKSEKVKVKKQHNP